VTIGDQVNIEGGRPGGFLGSATSEVPDRAHISDCCVIGPGSVMHGTTCGENCVTGIRCALDYNTRIGANCVLRDGAATNVGQVIPDNCVAAGVPARITGRIDEKTTVRDLLGFVPSEAADVLAYTLEEAADKGFTQKARHGAVRLDIADGAFVHPTAILDGRIRAGRNVVIDAGAILLGDIELGDNVNVGMNAVVRGRVAVDEKTFVGAHALIDSSRELNAGFQREDAVYAIRIGKRGFLDQGCVVRGATIEDDCMVGQVAACDYGATVRSRGVVASGSIVAAGNVVPADCFVRGLPATVVKKGYTDENLFDFFGFIPGPFIEASIVDQAARRAEKARIRNIDLYTVSHVEDNVWMEGTVRVAKEAWIDAGVIICGDITIGERSLVRCNVSLGGTISIGRLTHVYDQVAVTGTCRIGDYGWINHRCVIKSADIGTDVGVSLSGACEAGAGLENGSIVSNRTVLEGNRILKRNTRIEGIPAREVGAFLELKDRREYFGVSPFLWTPVQGQWMADTIAGKLNMF
jgi:carbonic anhydrase/acetyltransferase-like protein (isoleucine patch superfamily)